MVAGTYPFPVFEAEIRTTVHNVYCVLRFRPETVYRPEQVLTFQADEFMKRRYEFRYNNMKGDAEYRERKSYYFNFFPVNEQVLNSISLNAQEEGIPLWDRDVKRYIY